mmetsp:Transcript_60040/g.110301  ORF Transcript_60040/g.110301 Transcript_60040/m.110301 type:complete len:616 (-) Transcript_60040:146-1993(-)
MATVDVSEGARELVDISAEAVSSLGEHLEQIGALIATSKLQRPAPGERSAGQKIAEKYDLYREYELDVKRRKQEIEDKMEEDFRKMREWRKMAGTEGASLLDELKIYIKMSKRLTEELEVEKHKVMLQKAKTREIMAQVQRKGRKMWPVGEKYIKLEWVWSRDMWMRAILCSWVQCTFYEVRFKFNADKEKEKLRLEHHQKMRKARAQSRLDVIHREQGKRIASACFLRFQEEMIENRHEKLLKKLRQKFDDERLVMRAQLAQALGDEEAAKALVEEQTRRMEAARARQEEAERKRDQALKEKREALAEAKEARSERDDALEAQAKAEARADTAEENERVAKQEAEEATERADEADEARAKAEEEVENMQAEMVKKLKKIDSLQRMLAELGAESDSDAPPDERPPPFFVNDDGTRVPRPRARKERMAMAYREAEVARWEMRLSLAVLIDKEFNFADNMDRMKSELRLTEREVDEVRWANKILITDVNDLVSQRDAARAEAAGRRSRESAVQTADPDPDPFQVFGVPFAPPRVPFAPSTAGVSQYSSDRPQFIPAKVSGDNGEVRLLKKTPSAPIFMPSLCPASALTKGLGSEKILLAPLRNRKRKPGSDWKVGWH